MERVFLPVCTCVHMQRVGRPRCWERAGGGAGGGGGRWVRGRSSPGLCLLTPRKVEVAAPISASADAAGNAAAAVLRPAGRIFLARPHARGSSGLLGGESASSSCCRDRTVSAAPQVRTVFASSNYYMKQLCSSPCCINPLPIPCQACAKVPVPIGLIPEAVCCKRLCAANIRVDLIQSSLQCSACIMR